MISRKEFEAANKRGEQLLAEGPVAQSACYDETNRKLIIRLSNGTELGIPQHAVGALQDATPAELALIEISPAVAWESTSL